MTTEASFSLGLRRCRRPAQRGQKKLSAAKRSASAASFLGGLRRSFAALLSRHAAIVLGAIALVAGVRGFASAPALDRDAERWVKGTLERMTLDERIGQMLVPGLESTYLPTDSDVFDELARLVRDQHVGGFIAFGGSQPTPGVLLNPGYAGATLGQPLAAASTYLTPKNLTTVVVGDGAVIADAVSTLVEVERA